MWIVLFSKRYPIQGQCITNLVVNALHMLLKSVIGEAGDVYCTTQTLTPNLL